MSVAVEYDPKQYQWVTAPRFDTPSLDTIYGKTPAPSLILMPIGEKGADLWARCKQSEADLRECIKRGAM